MWHPFYFGGWENLHTIPGKWPPTFCIEVNWQKFLEHSSRSEYEARLHSVRMYTALWLRGWCSNHSARGLTNITIRHERSNYKYSEWYRYRMLRFLHVPLTNISLIKHVTDGLQSSAICLLLCAGRGLYRASPAVIWGLNFEISSEGPPHIVVASNNKQGVLWTYLYPDPPRGEILKMFP
jgi:hypothetical protein